MQNWLKMESSKSSVAVLPTISPTAFTAIRRSNATSSSVKSLRNASMVRSVASRARLNASWCRELIKDFAGPDQIFDRILQRLDSLAGQGANIHDASRIDLVR